MDHVGPLAAPPSSEFWFGTTSFGQDVFSQFVRGLKASFLVGIIGAGLGTLSGIKSLKIIFTEIAPNMMSYLLLVFILQFGGAVLITATLDFIGLGPTDAISPGLMMNNAVLWGALILGIWWWFIPPGLAITAIVGALYVTNVGLDEVFNPKLREM